MIDLKLLTQIKSINSELRDLQKRLDRISEKEDRVVKDSVQGSSKSFPYTKHTCVIEGIEIPKSKKNKYLYRKQIENKKYKLEKLIVKLEYELNYIDDQYSDIRQIIRYKYEDNKTWTQIMFLMNYNSEEKARIKLKRFFEKFLNCTDCTDIM